MRKLILLCLAALALCSCTMSKRVTTLVAPELPKPDAKPVDVKAYEEKYGKFDGIYLYIDQTIEHSGNKESIDRLFDSWTFYRNSKYKWIVFNPEETDLTTFRLGYKPKNIYAFVHPPDGAVRTYGLADMQKSKDEEGYDEYVFIFPDIKRGTVVELGYEILYGVGGFLPPIEHEFPLQLLAPCESLSVTYAYPDWWELDFRNTGERVDAATTHEWDQKNRKQLVKCVKRDVPAIVSEPFSPYFKEMAEFLQFRVTELEMIGFKPELPQTWTEIAERVDRIITGKPEKESKKKTFEKKKNKESEKIKEYAETLAVPEDSPSDKLRKIIAHVQDEFDLNSSFRGGNYAKVIKEKSGSMYDLMGLCKELLEHSGLPADIVMVSSADNGFFDEYFVSYEQLSYMGLRVFIGDTYRLVFPQEKLIPIFYVPESIQGQPALIVSGDESGSFWKVPFYDDQESSVIEEYDLTINDDGSIQVVEEKTMQGGFAQFGRDYFKYLKEDEQKRLVEDFLTYSDGTVALTSHSINNLEVYSEPLIFRAEYIIDNLVTITPEEVIFKTGGLFSPISLKRSRLESGDRVNPIVVRVNQHFNKKISIRYPENWKVNSTLSDTKTENGFGTLAVDYESAPGALSIHQDLLLKRGRTSKEKVGDFLALTSDKSDLAVPSIVFKRE